MRWYKIVTDDLYHGRVIPDQEQTLFVYSPDAKGAMAKYHKSREVPKGYPRSMRPISADDAITLESFLTTTLGMPIDQARKRAIRFAPNGRYQAPV